MEDIIIKDKKDFENKLNKIKKEGIKSLHVISDFDKTITKAKVKGQKTHTTIAQIREGNYLSEEYVKRSYELYNKYHPFETNNTLSEDKINKKMVEWWSSHINLLVEQRMNGSIVKEIIKRRSIKLRKNANVLFNALHEKKIPFLIFSAGVGDIIQGHLKSEGLLYNNICIISNFFNYDKKGYVKGYKSGIIHVYNKDEFALKETPYFEKIAKRKNVILLGDNLGDADMANGLNHETVLKIGFLNEDIEKNRKVYEEKFDAVILNDGPMDFVLSVIKDIKQQTI
jgi:cytosolic 5'-nucleotidase 3